MIKKFNQYNESLRDKMTGKSTDDLDKIPDDKLTDKFIDAAIIFDYLDGVKRYIDYHKSIGTKIKLDKYVHETVYRGNMKILKYFLDELDFELNKEANIEVRLSAHTGNMEMLKYFVEERGMSVVGPLDRPFLILQIAEKQGKLDIIKYIIDKMPEELKSKDTEISKYLQTYESLRDKMIPKPDKEVDDKLDELYEYLIKKSIKNGIFKSMSEAEYYIEYSWESIMQLVFEEGWSKEDVYNGFEDDMKHKSDTNY